jgi:hypothetical protein
MVGSTMLKPDNPKRLEATPGSGVIYNGPGGRAVNLVTRETYGDVELHLEFMVPKGSNSGVKFEGVYEIQIFDSHGVEKVTASHSGGVYPRAELLPRYRHIDEGYPPRVNASRPPGEWQTLDITFRAPRFDSEGKKVANARFDKVVLNDQVVQEGLEVPCPTGNNWRKQERPEGPILLQGDHGPVAFRNVRVRPLRGSVPWPRSSGSPSRDRSQDSCCSLHREASDAAGRRDRLLSCQGEGRGAMREFLSRHLFSPLQGMTAGVWWGLLRRNRFAVDPPFLARAAFQSANGPANSALARLEDAAYGREADAATIRPPLFILGHFRSGTTHLHNLLAQDPQFAFPTLYQTLYPRSFLLTESVVPRLGRFLLLRKRPHDGVALDFGVPNEDEMGLLNASGSRPTSPGRSHATRRSTTASSPSARRAARNWPGGGPQCSSSSGS